MKIFIIILILVVLLFIFMTRASMKRKYKDFLVMERMLKVLLYKKLTEKFEKENKDNPRDLAAGLVMIFTNQNLNDLKNSLDHQQIIDQAVKTLDGDTELRDIVFTYLRTKAVYAAMYEDNKQFMPIDVPTFELLMKFGSSIEGIKDSKDFTEKFSKFFEKEEGEKLSNS